MKNTPADGEESSPFELSLDGHSPENWEHFTQRLFHAMSTQSARRVVAGKADQDDEHFIENIDWVARNLLVPSCDGRKIENLFAKATKKAEREKSVREANAAAKEAKQRRNLGPRIDRMLAAGHSIREVAKALGVTKYQVEKRILENDPKQMKFPFDKKHP